MNSNWIPATATRNWCSQDPILDWLDLYGESRGFVRDSLRPGYDPDTDMGRFMRDQGMAFEVAVMRCLAEKFEIVRIAGQRGDAESIECFERTRQAMAEGVEIIAQAVVHDPVTETYGIPDLLVRSDVLSRLASHPPATNPPVSMYVVVDIKFTNLNLSAQGMVQNGDSGLSKKAQLYVYNRALGRMQGFEPPTAFLLGRGFQFKLKGVDYRGDGCFDRLGPADMTDPNLASVVDEAVSWTRRLRTEGANWEVLPTPSDAALYPNMGNTRDAPWHAAKKEIADQLDELTLLWYVTAKNRPNAHREGVITFSDARCESTLFDLSEDRTVTLQQIIEINRSSCPDLVRPARVSCGEEKWRVPNPLEFYVDFETTTNLDDDFSAIPKKGGNTLIYMIGCGHIEDGKWTFKVFTCDRLTPDCERTILDAWHAHMAAVRARLWPDGNPLVFHWSHAERAFLDTAYNSARERHPDATWPELNWYDFLGLVVRKEPVTVKGAMAFGLKAVAKGMHRHGLIETEWTNGPTDGLGAMVGAWRCDRAAAVAGGSMVEMPLMKSIEEYNEVDCRVMWEIVSYLRSHH